MKATAFLMRQHRKIERLVDGLDVEPRFRKEALLVLVDELVAHMAVEQRIFYPCAERAVPSDLARHRDTHRRARATLLRLADPRIDDGAFVDETSKLRAIVAEHVALEDRGLFVTLERVADDYALDRLGERMGAFHAAILSRGAPAPVKADHADVASSGAPSGVVPVAGAVYRFTRAS